MLGGDEQLIDVLKDGCNAKIFLDFLDFSSLKSIILTGSRLRSTLTDNPLLPCYGHVDDAYFKLLPWKLKKNSQVTFCNEQKIWDVESLLSISGSHALKSADLLQCTGIDTQSLVEFLGRTGGPSRTLTHLATELPWGQADASPLARAAPGLTHLHLDFHRHLHGLGFKNLRFLRIADVDPTDLHPNYVREWGISNIIRDCPQIEEVILGLKVAHLSQADAAFVAQEMRRRPLRISTRTRTAPVLRRVRCAACGRPLYAGLSSYLLHTHPRRFVALALFTHRPPLPAALAPLDDDGAGAGGTRRAAAPRSPPGEAGGGRRFGCAGGCGDPARPGRPAVLVEQQCAPPAAIVGPAPGGGGPRGAAAAAAAAGGGGAVPAAAVGPRGAAGGPALGGGAVGRGYPLAAAAAAAAGPFTLGGGRGQGRGRGGGGRLTNSFNLVFDYMISCGLNLAQVGSASKSRVGRRSPPGRQNDPRSRLGSNNKDNKEGVATGAPAAQRHLHKEMEGFAAENKVMGKQTRREDGNQIKGLSNDVAKTSLSLQTNTASDCNDSCHPKILSFSSPPLPDGTPLPPPPQVEQQPPKRVQSAMQWKYGSNDDNDVTLQYVTLSDDFQRGVPPHLAAICGLTAQRTKDMNSVPDRFAPGT